MWSVYWCVCEWLRCGVCAAVRGAGVMKWSECNKRYLYPVRCDKEERDVASRDLASTSTALDKKAAVPSAAVRIADVGIVRLPEHGRSGRLMRHLKPYPGVGTSTCWNAVQNWTRYVCITVYYTVS